MINRFLIPIFSLTLCLLLLRTEIAGAAFNTSLKQRILPLNCIFDFVNDGTNTIFYITPEICEPPVNPLIPEIPQDNTVVVTETITGGSTSFPQIFINRQQRTPADNLLQNKGIYLNSFSSFNKASGTRIILSAGQVVYFDTDDSGRQNYSIIIEEIGLDYIKIRISPNLFKSRINISETKTFDITGDGIANIRVTLNAVADGKADVTFKRLASSKEKLPNHYTVANNLEFYLLLVTTVLISLLLYRIIKTNKQ